MIDRRTPCRLVSATLCLAALIVVTTPARAQEGPPSPGQTPPDLVATYQTLADSILAVKKTEANLVRAILSAARAHARIQVERAKQAMKGNDMKGAGAALEGAAAAVAQMATEGDSAVGAVRKRLLEGGHHHNAAGEQKGIYDEGYVIVTRAAKQAFLDSSKAFAALAKAPKADAVDAEWSKVESTWSGLMK